MLLAGTVALALSLAACETNGSSPGFVVSSVYQNAIQAKYRTEDDQARDAARKPFETLVFTGIKPGDTVIEMEAGGGYFTPLLAATVGSEGKVFMQNPAEFANFWGGGQPPRMKDGSMPLQVTYLETRFDDLATVPDGSVDVVTWMQGPHEIWYVLDGATEQLSDADKTFSEIARVLKPGGAFIALDHAAPTGTAETSGGDTHRIDPNVIDMLAASKGLTKAETSDLFTNPEDDMTTNVFNPSIRGTTNQFLFRYVKS
jgi:predicted methyltransferase